jgi:hypothetical protein
MAKGADTHGAPAADRPNDVRNGEQAEKGDARHPFRQHHDNTRHSTRQDIAKDTHPLQAMDQRMQQEARRDLGDIPRSRCRGCRSQQA